MFLENYFTDPWNSPISPISHLKKCAGTWKFIPIVWEAPLDSNFVPIRIIIADNMLSMGDNGGIQF